MSKQMYQIKCGNMGGLVAASSPGQAFRIRPSVWLWVLWSGVQAIASLEGGLTTETPWRWLEESTALTEQDCRVDALASAAALYNGLRDRQIEAVFSAHDPLRLLAFDPQGHALGVWRWECWPDDRPESRS